MAAEDEEREKAQLGELIRELQERATTAEQTRDRLSAELETAREELDALKHHVAQQEKALDEAGADAEKRLETERATTTEVHARLAVAREEAQRTMVAEAEETERLREELAQARDEAERLLAAERAEVARLREELLSSEVDEAGEETSRRMLERVTRDLERERATSRNLRRELDELRSDSAEYRRAVSSSTANGTLATDEPPAGRPIRTPEGTQRRVEAARMAASARVPKVPPSPWSLWAVRIVATLVVAALGIALVILVSMATRELTNVSRGGAVLVVAALALAALSLLRPWALAFDPWAWVVWGRETGRLALDTSSGPSWKPFPVLFTTPLALLRRRGARAVADRRPRGRPARAGGSVHARDAARRALGGGRGRGGDGALAVVAVQHRARQLRGSPGRGGPVGGRRTPERPGARRARAADRRRADAPGGLALSRRLRLLALEA